MSITNRFVVYPLPDRGYVVRAEGYVLPARLTVDADMPAMPSDKVLELLLPIARANWATLNKKFAGENKREIVAAGDRAREQLRNLTSPQAHVPIKIRPRYT